MQDALTVAEVEQDARDQQLRLAILASDHDGDLAVRPTIGSGSGEELAGQRLPRQQWAPGLLSDGLEGWELAQGRVGWHDARHGHPNRRASRPTLRYRHRPSPSACSRPV